MNSPLIKAVTLALGLAFATPAFAVPPRSPAAMKTAKVKKANVTKAVAAPVKAKAPTAPKTDKAPVLHKVRKGHHRSTSPKPGAKGSGTEMRTPVPKHGNR